MCGSAARAGRADCAASGRAGGTRSGAYIVLDVPDGSGAASATGSLGVTAATRADHAHGAQTSTQRRRRRRGRNYVATTWSPSRCIGDDVYAVAT